MTRKRNATADEAADVKTRLGLLAAGALSGLLAAVVFTAFPGVDLFVSALFYGADGGFLFGEEGFAEIVRSALDLLFWAVCLASLAGLASCAVSRGPILGQGLPKWTFLVVLLAVGPGLIANALLKDHWGRARPDEIVAFGGHGSFTPALLPSSECTGNCAFVAGEVASVLAAGFGLALLARRRRRVVLAATVGLGALAAFIRIGQGAHFLSDAVFAAVFMMLTAAATHWLVFGMAPRLLDAPAVRRVRRSATASAPRPMQHLSGSYGGNERDGGGIQ